MLPQTGPDWPNSGSILGHNCPSLVDVEPIFARATSGRHWSIPGRICPKSVDFGPNLVDPGPNLVEVGPTLAEAMLCKMNLAEFGPTSVETGRNLAGPGSIWPAFAEFHPKLGTKSKNNDRSRPYFVQVRPRLGHIWATSTGDGPSWGQLGLRFEKWTTRVTER